MDYEEKLRLAKEAIKSGSYDRKTIEYIFPELKESEDECVERIKKEIISYLNNRQIMSIAESSATERWLTWLEKQGEKPTDKVEPKFKVGDIIRHKKQGFTCKIIAVDTEYRLSECNGTHLPFEFQDFYELVEQKPAWSEEDENMLKSIIATCELAEQDRDSSPARHLFEMQSNWLKSLKDRVQLQWKPSEEQMQVLIWCLPLFYDPKSKETLKSLIDDLKKL